MKSLFLSLSQRSSRSHLYKRDLRHVHWSLVDGRLELLRHWLLRRLCLVEGTRGLVELLQLLRLEGLLVLLWILVRLSRLHEGILLRLLELRIGMELVRLLELRLWILLLLELLGLLQLGHLLELLRLLELRRWLHLGLLLIQ